MDKSLLVIERIVLETLEGRSLVLEDLKKHTGFSDSLLKAVLHNLIDKGMISKRSNTFEINWNQKDQWLPLVTNKDGMRAEIMELFSSLLNEIHRKNDKANLKIQKIWLDKKEEEILKLKFDEIENFVQGIKEKRRKKPVKEITCERQVLFYGKGCYEDLVNNILRAS